MKNKFLHSDFGLYFWIHLTVEIINVLSWFLFSWWWIILAHAIVTLQYNVLGGCVLTGLQLGKEKMNHTFLAHYFKSINPEKLTFFSRYTLPLIVISMALIWQIVLKNNPLIF